MSMQNEGDQLESIRAKVQLARIGKQGLEGSTVELVRVTVWSNPKRRFQNALTDR